MGRSRANPKNARLIPESPSIFFFVFGIVCYRFYVDEKGRAMPDRAISGHGNVGRDEVYKEYVLIPFDRREAVSVQAAAEIAGRPAATVYGWCEGRAIGRRVAGGPYLVSIVALAMVLDGDSPALEKYLAGNRTDQAVTQYFHRCGLGDLISAATLNSEQAVFALTKFMRSVDAITKAFESLPDDPEILSRLRTIIITKVSRRALQDQA